MNGFYTMNGVYRVASTATGPGAGGGCLGWARRQPGGLFTGACLGAVPNDPRRSAAPGSAARRAATVASSRAAEAAAAATLDAAFSWSTARRALSSLISLFSATSAGGGLGTAGTAEYTGLPAGAPSRELPAAAIAKSRQWPEPVPSSTPCELQ